MTSIHIIRSVMRTMEEQLRETMGSDGKHLEAFERVRVKFAQFRLGMTKSVGYMAFVCLLFACVPLLTRLASYNLMVNYCLVVPRTTLSMVTVHTRVRRAAAAKSVAKSVDAFGKGAAGSQTSGAQPTAPRLVSDKLRSLLLPSPGSNRGVGSAGLVGDVAAMGSRTPAG